MAFSEKTKLEARRRSAFRCVICQKPFVHIHHIIPQEFGGSDELDNAAPLCAGCHDTYGDSPSKRKQIRQMRDYWYDIVEKRMQGDLDAMFSPLKKNASLPHEKGVALYHHVYWHEDFETTAQILLKLIANAQRKKPGKPRYLYLTIEEHRNPNGGFDADMYELQTNFMANFLLQYLTRAHMPLTSLENGLEQNDIIPDVLRFG